MKKLAFLILIATATTFTACKKDDNNDADPSKTGKVELELEHVFGSTAFALNSPNYYVTANNDSVKFTKLEYFVTNIKLTKSDNSVWTQPDSYYLYDAAAGGKIEITGVPEGDYKAIEFTIGVDSLRNVSGAQTGALDPATGMFWSWNSGYIFLKAEGESPQATGGSFVYHIGGFSGVNKAQRTIALTFGGDEAMVREAATPEVHLSVDVAKFFNGTTNLNVASNSTLMMPGAAAAEIANRYVNMFEFEHLHN